jgi:hypothetical protein
MRVRLQMSHEALIHVRCKAGDAHLRWPLVGTMQWQLGFLAVSCKVSAKVQPCMQCMRISVAVCGPYSEADDPLRYYADVW